MNKKLKSLKRWIPWIVFLGLCISSVYWASTFAQKQEQSRPGESVDIIGREHVSIGLTHKAYNSNPPTSGPHAGPAPWGFATEEIPDENAVHNLEHGGIWITYKENSDIDIETLRQIAKDNPLSVLISPRSANDTNIAVASWGRLMKLDVVDVDQINKFIHKNKNKSPEPLAR